MRAWLTISLLLTGCAGAVAAPPARKPAPVQAAPAPAAVAPFVETAGGRLDFTMDARQVAGQCSKRGGSSSGFVTSNRTSTLCKVASSTFPRVIVGYCPRESSERVCLIVEATDELPAAQAAASNAQRARQFTAQFGLPQASTDISSKWTTPNGMTIELGLLGNEPAQSVQVLYASADGLQTLANFPPEFPSKVIEFTFGTPKSAAKDACVSNSGAYFDAFETQDPHSPVQLDKVACMRPRTELPFELRNAYAFFCDDHLCEVELELSGKLEQALATVSSKYGAPLTSSETGKCKPTAQRYTWVWSSGTQTRGSLLLTDDCSLTLRYDDKAGWALRQAEHARRFRNF